MNPSGQRKKDGKQEPSLPDHPDRKEENRGVSQIIGVVLFFALVIILITILQTVAVPEWNQQVEVEHNGEVLKQFINFKDDVNRVISSDSGREINFDLGVDYPPKPPLINPPPASGTLRTVDGGEITIDNAVGVENSTARYWDGEPKTFSNEFLKYTPDYNYYQNHPVTVYENGIVYNDYNGNISLSSDQDVVRGDEINIVALNGSLFRSAALETQPLRIEPVNAPVEPILVENQDGKNIELSIPTRLSNETWEYLTEKEVGESILNGSRDYNDTVTPHLFNMTLKKGRYALKMGRAGIGSGYETNPDPEYLAALGGNGSANPGGESQDLEVQVRDRFNSPVRGVLVNSTLNQTQKVERRSGSWEHDENYQACPDWISPLSRETDRRGMATFTYRTTKVTNHTTVNVSVGFGKDVKWPTRTEMERYNFTEEVLSTVSDEGVNISRNKMLNVWQFDEVRGNTTHDSAYWPGNISKVNYKVNGEIMNNSSRVKNYDGRYGRSYRFTEKNQSVKLEGSVSPNAKMATFWINIYENKTTEPQTIFSGSSDDLRLKHIFKKNRSKYNVNENEWIFVSVSSSGSVGDQIYDPSKIERIGSDEGSNYLRGKIDELKIYDGNLNSSQLDGLANQRDGCT
ncbi:MAG: hypothetical protein ABEK59_11825 [Halobacteria archaeon]